MMAFRWMMIVVEVGMWNAAAESQLIKKEAIIPSTLVLIALIATKNVVVVS